MVIGRGRESSKYGWLCLCDCGQKRILKPIHLIEGVVKSCGCRRADSTRAQFTTHGGTGTKEYRAWQSMKNRCSGKYHKGNKIYYLERGIKVCLEWENDFESFLAHIGPAPSSRHSVDRYPNNDGNYEPENVRWATREQQMENARFPRRPNIPVVMFRGKEMLLPEAYRSSGSTLKYPVVRDRV